MARGRSKMWVLMGLAGRNGGVWRCGGGRPIRCRVTALQGYLTAAIRVVIFSYVL